MFMSRFEPYTYALLRIITGFLFLWHGAQKLLSYPAPMPMEVPPFILYVAGPIELVGGVMVMLGLFTSWLAFLASGLMAFAYFLAHARNAFLPFSNGGEPAVIYCFVFFYISARGAGVWSLDSLLGLETSATPQGVRSY